MTNTRWALLYSPKDEIFPTHHTKLHKVVRILRKSGIDVDISRVENTKQVIKSVRKYNDKGFDTLLVMGGDSVLNDVVNELMLFPEKQRQRMAIGVIPNGVMNDFAHYWGISDDNLTQSIQGISLRRIRKIDLGCVRYHNKQGEACHRYFVNCMNIGMTARLMDLRWKSRTLFNNRSTTFFLALYQLIMKRRVYPMRLYVNDVEIQQNVMTLCIGNAYGYGQTPNAQPYNGLLDVSIIHNPLMPQLIEGLYMFLRGRLLNHNSVKAVRTKSLRIDSCSNAKISIDGRLMRHRPAGPFRVEVHREIVNFITPFA